MFIWTLQNRDFLSQKRDPLVCSKKETPSNHRFAYRWMEGKYQEKKGMKLAHPLIWIFIQEKYSEKKLYDTLIPLEPSYHYGLKNKIVIELKLPRGIALKSSYSKWCCLLGYSMDFGRKPKCDKDWDSLFNTRNIVKFDHLQGVIPFVKRSWIVRALELNRKKLKKHGADFKTY